MTSTRYASRTGTWERMAAARSNPDPTGPRGRITSLGAGQGLVVPPPLLTGTLFGYNSRAEEGDWLAGEFGRTPIARCYRSDYLLPSSGAGFADGGFEYIAANMMRVGHISGQRLNMSVTGWDPNTVIDSTSALPVAWRNYAASVPTGWTVQLVMWHEWNLHTTDTGSDGTNGRTAADFYRAFPILAQAIVDGDAGRGRCIPVINPSASNDGYRVSDIPLASEMPLSTELHWDIYNNPAGYPKGCKAFGSGYRPVKNFALKTMATTSALGYFGVGYGWGIDEFGAPRRVGTRLPELDPLLGWGPASPQDIDGSAMADALTALWSFWQSQTVKPSTVIYFTGQGTWNQKLRTAGTANSASHPNLDAQVGDPRRVGFPITVDPTLPLNALKAMLATSRN